jgi:hypothetical protein
MKWYLSERRKRLVGKSTTFVLKESKFWAADEERRSRRNIRYYRIVAQEIVKGALEKQI